MRGPIESLAIVEQMYQEGMELKRAQFRREHPTFGNEEIEECVRKCVLDRPFDCPGNVIKL